MTVLDATHKLFDYFSNQHSFSMKKNFKDIVPISEDEALEQAIIKMALEDMEVNEIVKSTDINEEKCYVLKRPLESFDQSVTITHSTSFMIASILNEFCESIQDYTDAVNITNVEEKDIRNLVILNQHYKTEMTKLLTPPEDQNPNLGDNINFDNI